MADPTPRPLRDWPVQDAKARFSALLDAARRLGPQRITRRGQPEAVLISREDWDRLTGTARQRNIIDLLTAPEPRLDEPAPGGRLPVRRRAARPL